MNGVHKTYKLYVGGAFPRSESGRTLPLPGKGGSSTQICRASRKDLRNAVEAARKSLPKWSASEAMLRGQILHRVSELLWSRRSEFSELLVAFAGRRAPAADKEVTRACDSWLYYAGFCDKYAQLLGSVNPVPGPFFDFSMPEPVGVVSVLAAEEPGLESLGRAIAPVLVPGNSCVCLSSIENAPIAITLAEVLATSDVPAGVVNVLTGTRDELLAEFGRHRGFDGSLLLDPGEGEAATLEAEASDHVQRVRIASLRERQGLHEVAAFTELKTAWHSMGR